MYTIKTMNAISPVGLAKLPANQFEINNEADDAQGILVRSADLHDVALPKSLLAIARAGAGTNNIPIDQCTEQGIVVFNTPGANANAVAELVIGMLIAGSRNVAVAAQWCQGLTGDPAMAKTVEKGKKQFVGNEIKGITGVVQKGLGLALQHQHIRHVLHVPRHRHRPGDGILPKKCLLAEIQLEGKGDAGPGHMHDLLKIQSHSILLTWYRGYCSKKKRPCQILFFNFRKFMV